MIVSVAAAGATDDGDYSFEWPVETFDEWIEYAADNDVYVILDLQPGRDDFLSQAVQYEELLLLPFVGLLNLAWMAIPLLSLAYICHLLRSCRARTGRVMTLAAWGAFAMTAGWLVDSLTFYVVLHCGAIWLIRCLYAYSSLVPALLDAALSATAFLALAWALARSGSIFLATWCFFLTQALWTFIPPGLQRRRVPPTAVTNGVFEGARRRADAALRQLYSQ